MAAFPTNVRNVSSILWDISYATYVSRVVGMLQGKWTVPILCAVRTQPVRLSELRRATPTASKKAPTASVRSLEAANVVVRRDLSGSVLRVEYELADPMREPLATLLDHLAEWGKLCESEAQPTVAIDVDSLTPFRRIRRRSTPKETNHVCDHRHYRHSRWRARADTACSKPPFAPLWATPRGAGMGRVQLGRDSIDSTKAGLTSKERKQLCSTVR